MLVVHADTFKYPPEFNGIRYNLTNANWISVYDKYGNRRKRVPTHIKQGDTITYYSDFQLINNRLIGRGIQHIPTSSRVNPFWLRYTEFDKKTLMPLTLSTSAYLGYAHIDSLSVKTDVQMYPLNSTYRGVNYSSFIFRPQDSLGGVLPFYYANVMFNINTFSIRMQKFLSFKMKTTMVTSYFIGNQIKNIGDVNYDTLGNIWDTAREYGANFDLNLNLIDTFLIRQDFSKYNFSLSGVSSLNGIIKPNNEIHNFGYLDIYEKTNGRYVDSMALIHYKLVKDSIVFQKFMDEKFDYRDHHYHFNGPSIQNIIHNKDGSHFLVFSSGGLSENIFKVFKIDSNLNVIWSREYYDTINLSCCTNFYYEYHLHGFSNELGGVNLIFTGADTASKIGIYWLKIDSEGNVIKLNGKDYTTGSINEEIENSDFFVYPNPASNTLFIDVPNLNRFSYSLYDYTGRQLMEDKYKSSIDISHLSNGMYYIQIMSENGAIQTKKFEIRR